MVQRGFAKRKLSGMEDAVPTCSILSTFLDLTTFFYTTILKPDGGGRDSPSRIHRRFLNMIHRYLSRGCVLLVDHNCNTARHFNRSMANQWAINKRSSIWTRDQFKFGLIVVLVLW